MRSRRSSEHHRESETGMADKPVLEVQQCHFTGSILKLKLSAEDAALPDFEALLEPLLEYFKVKTVRPSSARPDIQVTRWEGPGTLTLGDSAEEITAVGAGPTPLIPADLPVYVCVHDLRCV